MMEAKWNHYIALAKQPASLTSQDERRRVEAEYFTVFATQGWDKEKSLLVLGCGDGYEIHCLKRQGWKYVKGVTFYEEEFAAAQELGVKDDVIKADIHDLPFLDRKFDYVISKETLEHLISPFVGLCEIHRVMKDVSRFVHYIPEGAAKQSDPYHYMCAPDWLWIDLMQKAGFEVSVTRQLDQNKYEGYKKP